MKRIALIIGPALATLVAGLLLLPGMGLAAGGSAIAVREWVALGGAAIAGFIAERVTLNSGKQK